MRFAENGVYGRWKHAAGMNEKIMIIISRYVIRSFERTARSAFKVEQYIRAEDAYVKRA